MALAVLGVMMVATVVGVVAMDDDGAADAAVSDTFTVGDLEYEVIADGEVEVSDTTSAYISGDLVIPSSVSDGTEQYSVTSIGVNAFWNCYGLTSVTIPDSVTSIEGSAFQLCSGLTSVTFTSQDPPTMGRYAFDTRTTLLVTSHWDPVTAMADAIGTSGKTTIVWANPPYPDLTFESDPVADGIIAYVTRETL